MGRLIIDGNQVYELDEACLRAKAAAERQRQRAGTGPQQRPCAGADRGQRENVPRGRRPSDKPAERRQP